MDALSSLLTYLRPVTLQAGRFDLGERQAVSFPQFSGIKCYAVIAGRCWIAVEGGHQTHDLEAGDCFLLPHGKAFSLESEPGSPTIDFASLVAALQTGRPGLYEGSPACTLAGGHFTFQGGPVDLLSGLLPTLVVLPRSAKASGMRLTLERMKDELLSESLGSSFLIQQLAYLMLVDAIRDHLMQSPREAVGWIFAMSDPQLRAVLSAIHDSPSTDWSLDKLAQFSGMSRSLFARRFKEAVGESPIEYLTRWRMLRASEQLIASGTPVIEIAKSLGYESESSFGKAYKRVTGASPRQHRYRKANAS